MKKLFASLVLFLFLGLFISANAQSQSGSYYFDTNTPNYTLHDKDGKRTVDIEVTFKKPFEKRPNIVLSVITMDVKSMEDLKYAVEPKSISRDNFVVSVTVWGKTQINSIGGNWLAHEE